jgi:hypothetical protein
MSRALLLAFGIGREGHADTGETWQLKLRFLYPS